jgi:hypothetical protein
MATIYVSRTGWYGLLRSYKILVDGVVIASLWRGRTVAIEVEPGAHSVATKMDWVQSEPLEVVVAAGESVEIQISGQALDFADPLRFRRSRD